MTVLMNAPISLISILCFLFIICLLNMICLLQTEQQFMLEYLIQQIVYIYLSN